MVISRATRGTGDRRESLRADKISRTWVTGDAQATDGLTEPLVMDLSGLAFI